MQFSETVNQSITPMSPCVNKLKKIVTRASEIPLNVRERRYAIGIPAVKEWHIGYKKTNEN